MFRYWLIAVLVLFAASLGVAQPAGKQKEEQVLKAEGKLTPDDPRDKVRNTVCKVYSVQMKSKPRQAAVVLLQ